MINDIHVVIEVGSTIRESILVSSCRRMLARVRTQNPHSASKWTLHPYIYGWVSCYYYLFTVWFAQSNNLGTPPKAEQLTWVHTLKIFSVIQIWSLNLGFANKVVIMLQQDKKRKRPKGPTHELCLLCRLDWILDSNEMLCRVSGAYTFLAWSWTSIILMMLAGLSIM